MFREEDPGQAVLESFSQVDRLEVVAWMESTYEFLQQFLPRNESTQGVNEANKRVMEWLQLLGRLVVESEKA